MNLYECLYKTPQGVEKWGQVTAPLLDAARLDFASSIGHPTAWKYVKARLIKKDVESCENKPMVAEDKIIT